MEIGLVLEFHFVSFHFVAVSLSWISVEIDLVGEFHSFWLMRHACV